MVLPMSWFFKTDGATGNRGAKGPEDFLQLSYSNQMRRVIDVLLKTFMHVPANLALLQDVAVSMVSTGLFMVLANVLLQTIFERWQRSDAWSFDGSRIVVSFVIGVVVGLFSHVWYTILEWLVPSDTISFVLLKVLMDQSLAGSCLCSLYIVGTSLLEGLSLNDIYRIWRYEFPILFKSDMAFWPPAQMINFLLVPDHFRLLYINVATLCWNIILGYLRHNLHLRALHALSPEADVSADDTAAGSGQQPSSTSHTLQVPGATAKLATTQGAGGYLIRKRKDQ